MHQLEVNTSNSVPLASRIAEGEGRDSAVRIVDAFAERAQQEGIRAIVLAELARSLTMSKKTLYKYFNSKDDLVYELVVRWQNRLFEPIEVNETDVVKLLRHWVSRWVANDARYSTAFWRELRDDYPELYGYYTHLLFNRMAAMRRFLKPYLRPGMDEDFTWAAYRTLVTSAARPAFHQPMGMEREAAVQKALDFWMIAAFDPERVTLPLPQSGVGN